MIRHQAVAPCRQPIAPVGRRILVIVPCGARKIWNGNFLAGPTPAKDAYVSTLFRLHRRYAEAFGAEWRILSAWYGIMHPDQLIEAYDARFRASDLHPHNWWRITEMFRQARALGGFDQLVLLGGSLYREIARRAFEGVFLPEQVSEPFAGMDLLRTLRALKLAVAGKPRDVSTRPQTKL